MINAPQVIIDALASGKFDYADLVSINLGDAYDTGFDVMINYTTYHKSISFGGITYLPDYDITGIAGISRKASTGSDKVDIEFGITDESIVDIIRTERYVNKPTSINRVIMKDGAVLGDFAIPVRTAWGLVHDINGDLEDRSITYTIDSSLGDLESDNGWYAINSSHQRRHPNDLIMNHSGTVMTEDQQDKYTTNFNGIINKQVKPPSLPKIYGYKNVEAVPIAMLKHRKTHTSYRHYFTTLIYVLNIGDCEYVDIQNMKNGDSDFDFTVVNNNNRDVGGWSARIRTPQDAELSSLLAEESSDLSFWFEGMDNAEIARMSGMFGKGLTLLFLKNRNRDDWLGQAPKITIPIKGSKVYDSRTGLTAYSRNPALQYADFLRSDQYGAGQRGISVLDSNIGELADHFDAIPDSAGNDGINSILIDVQMDTGNPLVDNMNIWMEGVRLFTSDYYGQFNVRVETKSPVVMSVNENDLEGYPDYTSGEFTEKLNQLTYSIKQLVKDATEGALATDLVEVDVEATFPETGTTIHTAWLKADGGIDNFDSSALDYVTDLEQAYYWCMVDARISRQPRELELPMGALSWLLETGDVIDFTSEILGMDALTWRVDEVTEDDGDNNVKLVAYDINFYTPDPDAVPLPVAFALPPTSGGLSPVSGLSIIEKGGSYYLDWEPLSSANILWYALEITKDSVLIYDEPKLAQPPFLLDAIVIGSYKVTMTSIGHQDEGGVATLDFDIALPETPTINVTAGNFSIEVYPSVTKTYLGSTFELMINNVNDFVTAQNKGTSGSFTVANLAPNTMYWLWVRTINIVGKSEWATIDVATLNDSSSLVDFIGLNRQGIIDDAVNEMQDQIQDITGENPQQNILNIVNDIFSGVEVAEKSFTDDAKIKTETSELRVDLDQVSSSITESNKVVADLEKSLSERVTVIHSVLENKGAEIKNINQTVVDLDSATATSITELTSSVEENTSGIVSLNQTVVDLDSATTTSINTLTSNVGTNTSSISTLNQTVVDLDSATATSINTLTVDVGNRATITALNAVDSKADGNASSISSLTTTVTNIDNDVSSAQLILNTHTSKINGLESRAFLGVDVNGLVSGIYINGSLTQSAIELKANTVSFVNPDTGLKDLYYDAASQRLIFGGIIEAGTLIRSPKIEFVGTTHMRISSATGFGSSNQFIEWFGLKLLTGADINYSQIKESNAITYLKVDGSAYFGGAIISGTLSNGLTSSTLDAAASAEIGPYGSNGGIIAINCSITMISNYNQLRSTTLAKPSVPSCTILLEEFVSGAWVTRQSANYSGSSEVTNTPEGNLYATDASQYLAGSFTYTDNKATTVDRIYRLKLTARAGFNTTGDWVPSQRLSINSQEE